MANKLRSNKILDDKDFDQVTRAITTIPIPKATLEPPRCELRPRAKSNPGDTSCEKTNSEALLRKKRKKSHDSKDSESINWLSNVETASHGLSTSDQRDIFVQLPENISPPSSSNTASSSEALDTSPSPCQSRRNSGKPRANRRGGRNSRASRNDNIPVTKESEALAKPHDKEHEDIVTPERSTGTRSNSTTLLTQARVHSELLGTLAIWLPKPRVELRETYVVYDRKSECCKVGSARDSEERIQQLKKNKGDSKRAACPCIDLEGDKSKCSARIPYGQAIERIAHKALRWKHREIPILKGVCEYDDKDHTQVKEYFKISQDEGLQTMEWIIELFDYLHKRAKLHEGDVLFKTLEEYIAATPSEGCDYDNVPQMNRFWSLRVKEAILAEQAHYTEQRRKDLEYYFDRQENGIPVVRFSRNTTNPEIKRLSRKASKNDTDYILIEAEFWWIWYTILGIINNYSEFCEWKKLHLQVWYVLRAVICICSAILFGVPFYWWRTG